MKQGFTLIELLVAITIVAILSVIGLTIYQDTIKNAKDAKIKKDIDAIAIAYEQHYNPTTSKYPPIEDGWFANGVPTPPQGGIYENLLESESEVFNICGTLLSDGNRHCKRSVYGTLADVTPPPPPPPAGPPPPPPAGGSFCADGTNDEVYSPTLVGCNGSVNFANSQSLCGSGWHTCSVTEYTAGGGRTIPSTAGRWLSTQIGSNGSNCPSSLCDSTSCWIYPLGNSFGLRTNNDRNGYGASCSELDESNTGYFIWANLNDLRGTMCCSN